MKGGIPGVLYVTLGVLVGIPALFVFFVIRAAWHGVKSAWEVIDEQFG